MSPTPDDLDPETRSLREALERSETLRRRAEQDLESLLERRSVRFARALSAAQERAAGVWRLARGTGKPAAERLRLASALLRDVGPRRFVRLLTEWSRPERAEVPIPPEADAPPPVIPPADTLSITILCPVCDPDPEHLAAALESVASQSFGGYQLVLIDDGSRDPRVRALLETAAGAAEATLVTRDERGGISAALNAGLERARGEWVCVLDHDDVLAPHALAWIATATLSFKDVDLVYSDEDKLSPVGERTAAFYKPAWSPDLLLSINYLCHLTAIRTELVRAVGGFRSECDGAQDYDLCLRVAPRARRIEHVPRILYHWRQAPGSTALDPEAKPYALAAGARALRDALGAWGLAGRSVSQAPGGGYRLSGSGVEWRVTVVIPTRDRPDLLGPCLESLRARTRWPRVEVLVVDNGSLTPRGREALERAERAGARVLAAPGPFNFGRLMNRAAAASEGEVLLFLNDDTEVQTPGWLEELLAHLDRPGVGAVGPLLRYPDGRIQHAGVLLGVAGVANHAFLGRRAPDHVRARLASNVSALTGACLAIRREAFVAAGGFDEETLPNSYGDVDLCLKLGQQGWRCCYVPTVELTHHEGASRGRAIDFAAERAMRTRWGPLLERDPFVPPLAATTDLLPPG